MPQVRGVVATARLDRLLSACQPLLHQIGARGGGQQRHMILEPATAPRIAARARDAAVADRDRPILIAGQPVDLALTPSPAPKPTGSTSGSEQVSPTVGIS